MPIYGGPTRDQVFLNSFGSPPPTVAVDQRVNGIHPPTFPSKSAELAQQAASYPIYFGLNVEIWKPNFDVTNQGRRASEAQQGTLMNNPANSPSRSQFVEGYTAPIQFFASANTWQTPAGSVVQSGRRLSQPSLKVVSPFTASAPIPTGMPWDI